MMLGCEMRAAVRACNRCTFPRDGGNLSRKLSYIDLLLQVPLPLIFPEIDDSHDIRLPPVLLCVAFIALSAFAQFVSHLIPVAYYFIPSLPLQCSHISHVVFVSVSSMFIQSILCQCIGQRVVICACF